MNIVDCKVLKTDSYIKASKQLKRFKSLEDDVRDFLLNVKELNDLGIPLGNGFYKARIINSDKNKGKSAGYRLITLLRIVDTKIYLVYIYDKSDLENINEEALDTLVAKI